MVFLYKNWVDIPFSVLGLVDFSKGWKMKLWNGTSFKVNNYMETLTVMEVIYENCYNLESRDKGVIIDIGANIGSFSVFASRLCEGSTVYSFEPSKNTFSYLLENININKLPRRKTTGNSQSLNKIRFKIKPLNLAVGRKNGFSKLYDRGRSGSMSMFDFGKKLPYEKVKVITLTKIFHKYKIKKCSFLKLDCEGSEYDILLNTPISVYKKIDTISLEFHELVNGQSHQVLVNTLKKNGFSVSSRYHNIENTIGYIYASKKVITRRHKDDKIRKSIQ